MFITLLLVTFGVSVATCAIVTRLFNNSIRTILSRIVTDDLAGAWQRYLKFAIYVVGISGGVRIWDLEKYITPRQPDAEMLVLNSGRWVLEVYRTIIGTLQSVAWMLLIFFLIALVAYVIVRGREVRQDPPPRPPSAGDTGSASL
jgi:hypothetical protein